MNAAENLRASAGTARGYGKILLAEQLALLAAHIESGTAGPWDAEAASAVDTGHIAPVAPATVDAVIRIARRDALVAFMSRRDGHGQFMSATIRQVYVTEVEPLLDRLERIDATERNMRHGQVVDDDSHA